MPARRQSGTGCRTRPDPGPEPFRRRIPTPGSHPRNRPIPVGDPRCGWQAVFPADRWRTPWVPPKGRECRRPGSVSRSGATTRHAPELRNRHRRRLTVPPRGLSGFRRSWRFFVFTGQASEAPRSRPGPLCAHGSSGTTPRDIMQWAVVRGSHLRCRQRSRWPGSWISHPAWRSASATNAWPAKSCS